MWKIYHLIFTLWIYAINAENFFRMRNSRGSDGAEQNKSNPLNVHLKYDYNANDNAVHEFRHIYNTNSRNSYGNLNNWTDSESHTQQFPNNFGINNLSTKPPLFNGNSGNVNITLVGNSFNAKLFEMMSSTAEHQNLVYSPISLQTLLAFIFTVADGKLYEELTQLLEVPNNRTNVAKAFEDILQKASLNTPPTTLIMANKLYYDYRFGPIDHSVRNLAKNSFATELEQMDFVASKKAASSINAWVSEKTRNLIQDIITPSSISGDTSALLLNTLYFKSEWLIKFAIYDTEVQPFYATKHQQVPVNMMYNEDVFRYGEFADDLQASVVELPYNASDLSMLLILPKEIEGLSKLEKKLRHLDFKSITEKLKRETVTVKLPKFKIEFETDMIQTLQKMGLNALFNNAGNTNLFKNSHTPLKVDQLKHKAFINVNEAGTEAAAVTVAKYVPLSIPINMKYFIADHPFVFVIRNGNTTLFVGHVVQL